jgi:hypothetical protein
MIHQKDGGQIGQTISYYKILEKLGEVRNFPTSVSKRVVENFRIPLKRSESGRCGI